MQVFINMTNSARKPHRATVFPEVKKTSLRPGLRGSPWGDVQFGHLYLGSLESPSSSSSPSRAAMPFRRSQSPLRNSLWRGFVALLRGTNAAPGIGPCLGAQRWGLESVLIAVILSAACVGEEAGENRSSAL